MHLREPLSCIFCSPGSQTFHSSKHIVGRFAVFFAILARSTTSIVILMAFSAAAGPMTFISCVAPLV